MSGEHPKEQPDFIGSQNMRAVMRELSRPFLDADCYWRADKVVGGKVILLAYVDWRSIQNRLDRVVGPWNWSTEVKSDGDRLMGGIGIRFVHGKESSWVWKWDGAGDKSMHGAQAEEHGRKAAVSDALKRAAVQWGMARHLYDLGETRAELLDAYPKGAPKYLVVSVPQKGGAPKWAVAPSVRELQRELLTIEDCVSDERDPFRRRMARLSEVRTRMGWEKGSPEVRLAVEAASAIWNGDVPVDVGNSDAKVLEERGRLSLTSHLLARWYEDGVLAERVATYAAFKGAAESGPIEPAKPAPKQAPRAKAPPKEPEEQGEAEAPRPPAGPGRVGDCINCDQDGKFTGCVTPKKCLAAGVCEGIPF